MEAPCYGSAIELARSTGATVSLWQRRYEDGWAYDLDELERLLAPETKLDVHQQSPQSHRHADAGRGVRAARRAPAERSIVLFSDEVYSGLEHDPADRLPAACDVYERAISLNTVSKAYGLPGLRIGWLACRDAALLERIRELKLYTTICSSAPSELLVALAVRHGEELMQRSRQLVLANLPLIDDLLARRGELFEWVRPTAGPIGFPRVAGVPDVQAWCERTPGRRACCCCRARSTDSRTTCAWASAAPACRAALERLDGYLG